MVLASPVAEAQEDEGLEAIGPWHGTYQLDRDDPRIHTRGGADLLRIQVIHSEGHRDANVSWVAGRAICEDPDGEPCEWVGASGWTPAQIVNGDLVFALPISADASDPFFVVMRRGYGQRMSGYLVNARSDFSFRFDAEIAH